MTYGTGTDHYPATSKLLHWLVAACVFTTAPVAIAMTRIGKGPTQDALYNLHKSLGVLILFLMVLRLINRLAAGALAAEAEIEQWQKTVSSIVHTLLYALLLAMPIGGYLANSAYGAHASSGCSNCRGLSARTKSLRHSCLRSTDGWVG